MKNIFDIGQFVPALTEQAVIADLVERSKRRRKEAGLTQKNLAVQSGVSLGSIRRFETTGEISLSSLVKIGRVIGCLQDFEALFQTERITSLKDYENGNGKKAHRTL